MTKLITGLGIAIVTAAIAGQSLALNPQPLPPGARAVTHSQHAPIRHHRPHRGIVHSVSHGVTAPLDTATGHSTGRRQHGPAHFGLGISQHKPRLRDPASGLPTGQRTH